MMSNNSNTDLTRHLESVAAEIGRRFAEAIQGLAPHFSAEWRQVGAGVAAYNGPSSPLTAIKGACPTLSPQDVDEAEKFLIGKGAREVIFELASWVEQETVDCLSARGYRQISEELVVLRAVRPEDAYLPAVPSVRESDRTAEWANVLFSAFDLPAMPELEVLGPAMAALPGAVNLVIADKENKPIAAAQMLCIAGIAAFAGDGTLSEARGRGLQKQLIEDRIRRAAKAQATHCVAEVLPDGPSMRNYLRSGFEVAYSRRHYARSAG